MSSSSDWEALRILGEMQGEELGRLLDDIEVGIRKYVVVDQNQLALLAPWVVHTWALDAFDFTPYLNIKGPTSSVGKTLLAEVLEKLCREGYLAGSVSEAVLFRYIEAERPTLFLDELDKALSNKTNGEAILQVLDTGFKRSGKALRNVPVKGGGWEAKGFSTFCPKTFQTIRTPPGELVNRSIPIRMKRKLPSEQIARKRDRKLASEFESIRCRCEEWSTANFSALVELIESDSVSIPEKLSDRAADILEPLFAIADLAGPERGRRVREAAVDIVVTDEDARHTNEIILEDTYCVFTEGGSPREWAWTSELLDALNAIEDRAWTSWNNGKGMAAKDLARALKGFGGKSFDKKVDGKVRKAYSYASLKDAFDRVVRTPLTPYFPESAATAATRLKNQGVNPDLSPATGSGKNASNSMETKGGSWVAAEMGGRGLLEGSETENGNGDLYAARVLAKYGGRQKRYPLTTAIRRECETTEHHAGMLLDLAVEAGAVELRDGWYTLPGGEARLPL